MTRPTGRPHPGPRRGFTLIELLVVMSIAAFLSALVILAAPKILERDRSVDAVNKINNGLQHSRARALRDGLPRGIRLIIDPTKAAPLGPLFVTEFQYIESPPAFVPNPDGPAGTAFAQFNYTTNGTGTVTGRECVVDGLQPGQVTQVVNANGGALILPTLGTSHRIIGTSQTSPTAVLLTLDQYPDAQLGAAGPVPNGAKQGVWRSFHFGIYGAPRPLLGEPTEQLPTDTCIDLSPGVSVPDGTTAQAAFLDYDILFAPSGQLVSAPFSTQGSGQVFLWVRDPTKVPTMSPLALGAPSPGNAMYMTALQQGGEQMIVVIKAKSGAVGAGPVYWPDAVSSDPYLNARKAVSGQ